MTATGRATLESVFAFAVVVIVGATTDRIAAAWVRTAHMPFVSSVRLGFVAALVYLAAANLGDARVARAITALLLAALVGHAAAVGVSATLARDDRPVHVVGATPASEAKLVDDLIALHPPVFVWQAPNVTREEGHVIVNGPVDAPGSTIIVSQPRWFPSRCFVTTTGEVHRGGVTVGVQQDGRWIARTTISDVGPFRATFTLVDAGEYQLFVANAVSDRSGWNNVELSSIAVLR